MSCQSLTGYFRVTAGLLALIAWLALPLQVAAQAATPARGTDTAPVRGVPPPANAASRDANVGTSTNAPAPTAPGLQQRAVEQFRQLAQHPYFYPALAAVPLLLALIFLVIARNKQKQAEAAAGTAGTRAVLDARRRASGKAVHSCNVFAPGKGSDELLQFGGRSGGFAFTRQQSVDPTGALPANAVVKGWRELWQRKLNIAWLPQEHVFLRVVHLPKSDFAETLSMVELQLEKLSPIPVAQIVWSIQIVSHFDPSQQTVIVVIVARSIVEEFLGRLEQRGYLADRLELPFLDQLNATGVGESDGAWVFPGATGNERTAVVAWYYGQTLRNLDFIILAPEKQADGLREQLTQMAWAGELEGWLTAQPEWHLVADSSAAALWEPALRDGLSQDVKVQPLLGVKELAAVTARRTAQQESETNLLPPEYTERYQQQFVDRLWMRALGATVVVYIAIVSVYLIALQVALYRTRGVEALVAEHAPAYTNALQLKAQFEVLKDRQELKYAALDSWRAVAELLPEGVTLDGFNFNDGKRLTLNGTAPMGSVQQLYGFEGAMRKASLDGEPLFAPNKGENLSYRTGAGGAELVWNFSLELKRTEVQ